MAIIQYNKMILNNDDNVSARVCLRVFTYRVRWSILPPRDRSGISGSWLWEFYLCIIIIILTGRQADGERQSDMGYDALASQGCSLSMLWFALVAVVQHLTTSSISSSY